MATAPTERRHRSTHRPPGSAGKVYLQIGRYDTYQSRRAETLLHDRVDDGPDSKFRRRQAAAALHVHRRIRHSHRPSISRLPTRDTDEHVLQAQMHDLYVNASVHAAAALQHRVLLVTNSYDRNIDGVALTLNRLVGHLIRRGHNVLVVCPSHGRRPAALRAAGAPVVRVPSLPFPVWREYRLTFGLTREARRRIEAFDPTVVHVRRRSLARCSRARLQVL